MSETRKYTFSTTGHRGLEPMHELKAAMEGEGFTTNVSFESYKGFGLYTLEATPTSTPTSEIHTSKGVSHEDANRRPVDCSEHHTGIRPS